MAALKFQVGDTVFINGPMYMSANGTLIKKTVKNQKGVIAKIAEKGAHPYMMHDMYGWFNGQSLRKFVEVTVKVGDRVKVTRAVSYDGQAINLRRSEFTILELIDDKAIIGNNGIAAYTVNAHNLKKI